MRRSLASRLLAGGLLFIVLVMAGAGSLLLLSREQQTQNAALSNADNRAGVAAQLIERVAEPEAEYAANALAATASLQEAMEARSPGPAVTAALHAANVVPAPGMNLEVLTAGGSLLYRSGCAAAVDAWCGTAAGAVLGRSSGAAQRALTIGADVAGVEISGGLPSLEVAAPVYGGTVPRSGKLGVVVYSAPLQAEFQRFGPVIGFTPVFVSTGTHPVLFRYDRSTPATAAVPAALLSQVEHAARSGGRTTTDATYAVSGDGAVAGSFVPLSAPGGAAAGLIGVEVPLSLFAAGTAHDEATIIELTVSAVLAASVLVLLFVDRFVRRPVAQLERGVSRIAAGDYSQDVDVPREDELGRLALSVNRMRARIAEYVAHIDGALGRLQTVSRALTTTADGVQQLQDAVMEAAAATAGPDAAATLFECHEGRLVAVRTTRGVHELDAEATRELMAGNVVRRDDSGHVLALPLFLQGAVWGALLVATATPVAESDERSLQVLANNGAVALQNAIVFEQQALAVERLRELNQLKGDFLDTTQHELRTPVLAIRAQLELLAAAWGRWDDTAKLDALRDMEVATTQLDEVVETIVEFTLLSGDAVDLRVTNVAVRTAVEEAIAGIRRRFKEGLPASLRTDIDADIAVRADPARLQQVLRAVIGNALKFTPRGGSVTVRACADADGFCRIEVRDTGGGIAPEALARVFEPFFQQDSSRTRRTGGMGLGLTLARRLCEAHDATIEVRSTAGNGTTVTLHWPAADGAVSTGPSRAMRLSPRARVA